MGCSRAGALALPGLVSMHVGTDLALREGGWSFVITNDWTDAEAYGGYDSDPLHLRYRTMLVEVCTDVARVQFES